MELREISARAEDNGTYVDFTLFFEQGTVGQNLLDALKLLGDLASAGVHPMDEQPPMATWDEPVHTDPQVVQDKECRPTTAEKLVNVDKPRRARRTREQMNQADLEVCRPLVELLTPVIVEVARTGRRATAVSNDIEISDVELTKAASLAATRIGPVGVKAVLNKYTGGMVSAIPNAKRQDFLNDLANADK